VSFAGSNNVKKKKLPQEEIESSQIGGSEAVPKIQVGKVPSPLNNIDRALLIELLNIFNADLIRFYRDHDFNGSYPAAMWRPLSSFCDIWDDVTHEFIDEGLEAGKKQLYDAAFKLGNVMSKNSSPINTERYSVYPNRLYSDLDEKRFQSEAKEINDLCYPFVQECEKFIRYARERLAET